VCRDLSAAPPPRRASPFGNRVELPLRESGAGFGDGIVPGSLTPLGSYVGPVAEDVPYHPIYHPFNWRGWVYFGVGALGDMGAHLIDHPFWALGLTHPTSIEATSTQWGTMPIPPDPNAPAGSREARGYNKPVSYPVATAVHYQFPERGAQPPVKLSWYDGGLYPPRPDVLPDESRSERGRRHFHRRERNSTMRDLRIESSSSDITDRSRVTRPQDLPRISWSHEMNWESDQKAKRVSPIEYAAS
jgi:hypothetical protein